MVGSSVIAMQIVLWPSRASWAVNGSYYVSGVYFYFANARRVYTTKRFRLVCVVFGRGAEI